MKLRFSRRYFVAFLAVLAIEIFIAVAIHDAFVRPFVGDVLVVVLVYCFVRAFVEGSYVLAIAGVFAFACAVELAQLFQLGARLRVPPRSVLGLILGSHFDPKDFLAYLCGALVMLGVERARIKRHEARPQPQLD